MRILYNEHLYTSYVLRFRLHAEQGNSQQSYKFYTLHNNGIKREQERNSSHLTLGARVLSHCCANVSKSTNIIFTKLARKVSKNLFHKHTHTHTNMHAHTHTHTQTHTHGELQVINYKRRCNEDRFWNTHRSSLACNLHQHCQKACGSCQIICINSIVLEVLR